MKTSWQDAEAEHDIIRERLRAERHLRMAQRRETHLWPIAAPTIIAGLVIVAAAIQGGALHV